jgi:zinc resistance-associated protein
MWKMVLAGTTALAIAGGTLAYAQQPGPGPGPRGPGWRPSAEDRAAFADARIAALHAGLKLTPDQEKNWPAVEGALHDLAKQRDQRRAERAGNPPPQDPIERLARRAERMQGQGAALKKLADAAGPLYRSLDDAQKHRFMLLARVLRPEAGPRGMRGMHREGGWWRRFGGGRGPGAGPMGPQRGPQEGPPPSRL